MERLSYESDLKRQIKDVFNNVPRGISIPAEVQYIDRETGRIVPECHVRVSMAHVNKHGNISRGAREFHERYVIKPAKFIPKSEIYTINAKA